MKLAIFFILIFANLFPVHAQDFEQVNALIKKYQTVHERPKSCPLESKGLADILAKSEAIKNIFKSNCLQKDPGKMTEILGSIKDFQDELKKRDIIDKDSQGNAILSVVTGSDSTNSNNSSGAINGAKFSSLFSNITTMIKKNQCNLEDGRVLEMTADLINDSTQLGLLSGNELGVVIAGGGFIVSSSLRLIDMIIKQKFDFEKNQDRQTFIKLNCSFYNIRHDLEVQGAFDVENNSNRDDLRDAKDLIEKLNASLKAIEQEKKIK